MKITTFLAILYKVFELLCVCFVVWLIVVFSIASTTEGGCVYFKSRKLEYGKPCEVPNVNDSKAAKGRVANINP